MEQKNYNLFEAWVTQKLAALHWSKKDLAERLQVSQSYLADILGQRRPGVHHVERIIQLLSDAGMAHEQLPDSNQANVRSVEHEGVKGDVKVMFRYMRERTSDLKAMTEAAIKGAGNHIRMQRNHEKLRYCEWRMKELAKEKQQIDERIAEQLKAIMDHDGARSAAISHMMMEIEEDLKEIHKTIEAELENGYEYPVPLDGKVAG